MYEDCRHPGDTGELASPTEIPSPSEPEARRGLISGRRHYRGRHISRRHDRIRRDGPAGVAEGQGTPGALNDEYDIPRAYLRYGVKVPFLLITSLIVSAWALARHVLYLCTHPAYQAIIGAWTVLFVLTAVQLILSWRDRPWSSSPAQDDYLARLRVAVSVPVYNEDPVILDRCLWALAAQTRPADLIEVVDDGSDVSYEAIRFYWAGRHGPTEIRWRRQPNGGKKVAQAATFMSAPEADIFATIDSDTCLERRALEEGLKPFANSAVMSVAGLELAMNSHVNWLTRTVSARTLFFQLVPCRTQSYFGEVLVNRGTFALYRAPLVRDIVPAYIGETFLGQPVALGDDAALTLFASDAGRAVQQSTAFAFTMSPEKLSHHFRQWTRWMRGSAIRNCWRVRYLPLWSWGWWYTVAGIYTFLASVALPVVVACTWPRSEDFTVATFAAMISWSYLTGLRVMAVRRSDESTVFRIGTWLSYFPATLWCNFVLRPIRLYGILTCLRQGWTTRTQGAESLTVPEEIPVLEGSAA